MLDFCYFGRFKEAIRMRADLQDESCRHVAFCFVGGKWRELVGPASPAQSKACPFRTAIPKLSATVFPSRNLTGAGTAMVPLETFQTLTRQVIR